MDAVTEANRRAWEMASHKHVREYDDLLAQAAAGSSLNAVERGLLAGILADAPEVVHLQSGHGLDDAALVQAGARSVLPRVDRAKPLVWTPARETRFRAELDKRLAAAATAVDDEDRVLTTVERQALWAAKDLRPVPSMVWMPAHAGEFADYLDQTGERLAVLFIVAMYTGMRRDELLGLTWSEIDLNRGAAFVRETASGDGPKSAPGALP